MHDFINIFIFIFAIYQFHYCLANEMTFELPDNEKQCFFEIIDKDVKCTLEYQVITGGNYDVDVEISFEKGNVIHKDSRKQYDSFTWSTMEHGEYKFCFSNEFSTFTHKVVYFDFQVGEDTNNKFGKENVPAQPLTQLETSAQISHNELKVVIDYQTHHRLRETQGRAFAEDLNQRVQLWSVSQTLLILFVGIGQVFILRSLFSNKPSIGSGYTRT